MFDGWRDDVLTGPPPVLFPIGSGDLARIEIGPGLVTLIGGAPGAGKSALAMQGPHANSDQAKGKGGIDGWPLTSSPIGRQTKTTR